MGCALKTPSLKPPYLTPTLMTFEIASALLNRANTGSDLLRILDSIAADQEAGTVTDTDGTPIIW